MLPFEIASVNASIGRKAGFGWTAENGEIADVLRQHLCPPKARIWSRRKPSFRSCRHTELPVSLAPWALQLISVNASRALEPIVYHPRTGSSHVAHTLQGRNLKASSP